MEIITLQRRKNELKEDREMLNIALDSKQQELELVRLLHFRVLDQYPNVNLTDI